MAGDTMDEATQQNRLRMAWAGVFVLGLVAAGLMLPRFMTDEGEGPAVAAVPTADGTPTPSPSVTATPTVTPTPTPTPSAMATPTPTPTSKPTPTPTPTPTVGPGETVLFRGGPAQGPWQQLGTVAEITHPDAPPSARYFYTNFWSDPEEEDRPAELWDRLVKEVTEQLVELGDPVGRPAFGAAEDSESFNASGGLQDIYSDDQVYSALWSGVYEGTEGVGRAYFLYLINFDNEVIASHGPVIYREDGSRTFEDNGNDISEALRAWAAKQGFAQCDQC